ncbi:MAG: acetyltransferase [Candidatus Muproteobacteria bacterium RIFCSPLOWO2_01_FULL_60_18]|uniref:Acetyltransferase n=1 Tax=Candidatus Muproteobacteria bacterium RIFCSPLOWO2_01_FULL_60_18 TaxID=1817768 RepID=A0A1F6U5X2_9PROT|nr:MAG: acetyltransferase [Candidatus Muproteobacteria bacterium RIFCSPLOWO2_01_FULL_60_18]
MNQRESQRRLAEAVRDACRKAAQEAYENAGVSGLCEEGRWECAVSALRSLDLEAVIDAMQDDPQK